MSLFERKLIARIQRRRGPSNCGVLGIFQPIADALKLLFKASPLEGHSAITICGICLLFTISLCQMTLIPIYTRDLVYEYGLLLVALCHSLITFSEVLVGISSGSRYGIIGGNRVYVQNLGSHLSFAMMIIAVMLVTGSASISAIPFSWEYIPLAVTLFITILLMASRIPFDFTEAESELVGGAYVEYGGILFALIYLSDYLNLLFISALYATLFLSTASSIILFCETIFVAFFIILLRAMLPRYTQMQMIKIVWEIIIPMIALLICFVL